MTREEAINTVYSICKDTDIFDKCYSLIHKIYNDFEEQKCEKCIHFEHFKGNVGYCSHFGCESTKKEVCCDFGCKLFESKKPNRTNKRQNNG